MAYLGNIFVFRRQGRLIYTRYIIPEQLLAEVIGQYATYGGYIYVG